MNQKQFFYERRHAFTVSSARQIAEIIMEEFKPSAVVDVGCGIGTWLAVFREKGAKRVLGLDAAYVDTKYLQIAPEEFIACDLRQPPPVEGTFDLAISLEVAEHLPQESAESFVQFLTGLAPVILFSAAIPMQAGSGHLNEQWPDYWAALFERSGFGFFDCIRDRVWDDPDVLAHYAQNTFLALSRDVRRQHTELEKNHARPHLAQWRVVHPGVLSWAAGRVPPLGFRNLLAMLPGAAVAAVRRRLVRGSTSYFRSAARQ